MLTALQSENTFETVLVAACANERMDIIKYLLDRDEKQQFGTEKIIETKDTVRKYS